MQNKTAAGHLIGGYRYVLVISMLWALQSL